MNKTLKTIQRNYLKLNPNMDFCIIACSGGADSMALAFAISQMENARIAISHVEHDIRPYEERSKDLKIVMDFSIDHNVECVFDFVQVRDLDGNCENNARKLRYDSLWKTAKLYDSRLIATAHHADDQLETLIMRICRGSGPAGMVGISESSLDRRYGGQLIRPMLNITKDEIVDFCKAYGIEYAVDSTNDDTDYTRNRIRKEVIPVLKELFPSCSEKANSVAKTSKDIYDILKKEASAVPYRQMIDKSYDHSKSVKGYEVSLEEARRIPSIVICEFIRSSYSCLNNSMFMDRLNSKMVEEAVYRIMTHNSRVPWRQTWAGVDVEVDKDYFRIFLRDSNGKMSIQTTSAGSETDRFA